MAARLQELAVLVEEEYDGDAARIWTEASDGKDLLKRVQALPGFGKQKAQIFVALLAKQLGVRPTAGRQPPATTPEAATDPSPTSRPRACRRCATSRSRRRPRPRRRRAEGGAQPGQNLGDVRTGVAPGARISGGAWQNVHRGS